MCQWCEFDQVRSLIDPLYFSFAAGILGLDLFPILIGTIPVIALIVPTVFCGSLAYMGSLDNDDGADLYPWAGEFFFLSFIAIACIM